MLRSTQNPLRGFYNLRILSIVLVTFALWNAQIASVNGAPAKIESNETPFLLEPIPPQIVYDDNTRTARTTTGGDDNGDQAFSKQPSALDSYGNPIESLKPISTPDGRKVISAEGLQFEIPSYASGITEIRPPADDLLPPFIDTIAVALPDDENVTELSTGSQNSIEHTTPSNVDVDVEHAQIVELPNEAHKESEEAAAVEQQTEAEAVNTGNRQAQEESMQAPNIVAVDTAKTDVAAADRLPDYLLELNDPDIGGPVDYTPPEEGRALKVLAWDLLPPTDADPLVVMQQNNAQTRHSVAGNESEHTAHTTATEIATVDEIGVEGATGADDTTGTHYTTNSDASHRPFRGKVHFTSTTTRSPNPRVSSTRRVFVASTTTTTHRPTTTTTTRRPTRTTTTTTTTTKRPTTTPTTTTTTTTAAPLLLTTPSTTTTTTTEEVDTSNYYRLEKGDSYTLPPWLADFEDPDLDVAIEFVIPDDLNAYNHTVATDIEPPLEPFTDLSIISLPAPTEESTTTSTTTVRPPISFIPATTSTKLPSSSKSFNNRFTNTNHFAQSPQLATDQAASFSSIISTKQSTQVPLSSSSSSTSSPSTTTTTTRTTTTSRPTTIRTTSSTTTTTAAPTSKVQQNIGNGIFTALTTDPLNTRNVDISSGIAPRPVNPLNPFLQPKPFSKNVAPTTPIPTTTTTTTTTTIAPLLEENPFDTATLPSWLSGLDYPDLAPGVPYIYNPMEPESVVANDLEPPAHADGETTAAAMANKPVFITSPTSSLNSFLPKTPAESSTSSSNFPNNNFKKTTAPTSTTSSSSTATSPSQTINQSKNAPVTRPPIVFIPPPPVAADGGEVQTTVVKYEPPNKQTSSTSFNKNFVAPFEQPTNSAGAGTVETTGSSDVGASTSQDSFPPFEGKTQFTKSDDGKVISHNVLPTTAIGGGALQGTGRPFGFGNNFATPQKDFQATQTNQYFSDNNGLNGFNTIQSSSSASRFGSASSKTSSSSVTSSSVVQQSTSFGASGATGFTKSTTTVSGGTGKYTGGFGGAPGVLGGGRIGYAVQADGSIRDPEQQYRPTAVQGAAATRVAASSTVGARAGAATNPAVAASTTYNTYSSRAATAGSYQNRFGGPPGILIPYDNNRG